MRLALLVSSLRAGGAERVVSRLAAHWSDDGHEVHVLTLAGREERTFYPLPPGVRLHTLGLAGRSRGPVHATLANLRRVWRLRRVLGELAPTALLALLPETGTLAVLAALGRRVPVIVSERNSPVDEPLAWPWRTLRGLAYRAATAVVFQTERARDMFPARIRGHAVVIPNPVPIPAAIHADSAARLVVAVGRLVPQKGFDLLLRAFAGVTARRPEWRLTIWGEGPERAALEALAQELGVGQRGRLPGLTTEPDGWQPGGSIFVLPSRFEGFPNVLGEAMAAGYAVIAADCRFGPREMVTDGEDGLLVPPGDVAALAAALQRLMADDELRHALGRAARHSVRRFEPRAVVRRWDRLLAEVTTGMLP